MKMKDSLTKIRATRHARVLIWREFEELLLLEEVDIQVFEELLIWLLSDELRGVVWNGITEHLKLEDQLGAHIVCSIFPDLLNVFDDLPPPCSEEALNSDSGYSLLNDVFSFMASPALHWVFHEAYIADWNRFRSHWELYIQQQWRGAK